MWLWLFIGVMAYLQTLSFAMNSRARNRDHMTYHAITTVASNIVWFLTFRELVVNDMNVWLLIPYTAGTTIGSLTGAKLSMRIEKWLNARADGKHLL